MAAVAVLQGLDPQGEEERQGQVEERKERQALRVAEGGARIEARLLGDVADAEDRDERRVLKERDKVVAEGRQYPPKRLGKEHVTEGLALRETERPRGLGLAAGERRQAPAHGLGLEGAVGADQGRDDAGAHRDVRGPKPGKGAAPAARPVKRVNPQRHEHEGDDEDLDKDRHPARHLDVEGGDVSTDGGGGHEPERRGETEGDRKGEGDRRDGERDPEPGEDPHEDFRVDLRRRRPPREDGPSQRQGEEPPGGARKPSDVSRGELAVRAYHS